MMQHMLLPAVQNGNQVLQQTSLEPLLLAACCAIATPGNYQCTMRTRLALLGFPGKELPTI
jgi:hypothetical protein